MPKPSQEPLPESAPPFIEVRNLHKELGGQEVLRGIDFTFSRGSTTVVLGQSGEGKSVLLKHLIGLMIPDSGSILVDGEEIVGLTERQFSPVRRKVGVLFQDGALFDSMTVAENVAFPLKEKGVRNRRKLLDRVTEVLSVVGLEENMGKMPIEISGGMRKRVALARAVITRPQCVLYDEPTAGLDPIVADSIDHLILRLEREFQITSIVVTHDMKSMNHIARDVAVLRGGRIYFSGTPRELNSLDDPVIQNFIHGRSEETLAYLEEKERGDFG